MRLFDWICSFVHLIFTTLNHWIIAFVKKWTAQGPAATLTEGGDIPFLIPETPTPAPRRRRRANHPGIATSSSSSSSSAAASFSSAPRSGNNGDNAQEESSLFVSHAAERQLKATEGKENLFSFRVLFNPETESLALEGEMGYVCLNMSQFYKILETTVCLTTLELSYIILEESEAISVMKKLGGALQGNTSLTSLTLKGNHLKSDHLEILAPHIARNNHLEVLDVSCNNFGDKALGILTGAILRHPTLTTLRSSGNAITNDGVVFISVLLEKNRTLTSLFLCENKIGPLGAHFLANALEMNPTLQELHLYGNSLGPEGAKELARALQGISSIRVLDLTKNNLGDQGAINIAAALPINRSLRSLNLAWNSIHRAGGSQLYRSLEKNLTLRSLCCYWNNIGIQELRIDRRIRRNRYIKASAELYLCVCYYTQYCSKSKEFAADLQQECPEIGSFFSITSRLPPELQLTVTGFFFGIRGLAPDRIIQECRPPFGTPEEPPIFYWRAGSRFQDGVTAAAAAD